MTEKRLPDQSFLRAISRLVYCNPFTTDRIECEKAALGSAYQPQTLDWNNDPLATRKDENHVALMEKAGVVLARLRDHFSVQGIKSRAEYELYCDLVYFVLFHTYGQQLTAYGYSVLERGKSAGNAGFFRDFARDYESLIIVDKNYEPAFGAADLFARFFQLRRAFIHIFRFIVGTSSPVMELRAKVWEAIFTHDQKRYQLHLIGKTNDFPTLITGPTGTGKELVARAIGLSSFIPFEPKDLQFKEDFSSRFFPVNLAALSSTLIESELFGHRKGAFTGAVTDHKGYFEECGATGAVFLDEIGECDVGIQVKLLRVLQSREFQRLGDTSLRRFYGRVIAATHRDLPKEIERGNFREDFYYRLCATQIETPSLATVIMQKPEDLAYLVSFICRKIIEDEEAASRLVTEVLEAIGKLGNEYPWPGNFRELEQCVRSVLMTGRYTPAGPKLTTNRVSFTPLEEMTKEHVQAAFTHFGTLEATARALEIDRRTVKKYLVKE